MRIFLCAFLLLAVSSQARLGLRSDGALDIVYLRETYQDGELETVRGVLEAYRKTRENTGSQEEKIFLYKYLGVIYAAENSGRDKAEACFHQLLTLSPDIQLADMYVSKGIQALFEEVRETYLHSRDYQSRYDAFGKPLPPPQDALPSAIVARDSVPAMAPPVADANAPAKDNRNRKWLWWGAGLGAAAVGAGLVIWIAQDEEASPGTHYEGGF